METVQILENHEPVKALRDYNISDAAALNPVLKDKSKAAWIVSLMLGAGFTPLLWDDELLLMRFSHQSQSLFMVKSNNSGRDVKRELTSHYGVSGISSKVARFAGWQGNPSLGCRL